MPSIYRITRLGVFALLLLVGLPSCTPQAARVEENPSAPTASRYGTAVEQTRAYAARLYDSLALPGLSLAVAVDDRIVMTAEFGYSDIAAKTPITPTSLFRIGSVSKLLTAAAAARLVQRGKLDLDAAIIRYLPDLPADKANITARQLGGHLAGIRHYAGSEFINVKRYDNVADGLVIFIRDTLRSAPGTKYFYTSNGFNLLGAVMQAAAGREYRDLIEEEVTRPLGLTHTMVEASLPAGQHPVGYYVKNEGMLAPAPVVDLSDRWPSGGFLSTASELARFGSGILRSSYLSDAMRATMFTPQKLADGSATNVGLAWRVATDSAGRQFLHHGGEAMGGRAFLLVYPEERVVVAILANQSNVPIRENEAGRIARLFLP
jgi:serine beta-lactamase-like protein LACTB, mitochondrial